MANWIYYTFPLLHIFDLSEIIKKMSFMVAVFFSGDGIYEANSETDSWTSVETWDPLNGRS